MKYSVWKDTNGRDQLNDWYDRFREKIEAPAASQFVPTRHGPSHVLIAGPENAPPLVCLHAMRTGSAFLLSEMGPILKNFRVYAPDLPGQSIQAPEVKLSLKDDSHATWLGDITDSLGIRSANFLGVSWGGFIARQMASRFPDRVNRMALMVPAGIANGSHTSGLLKMAFPMMRYRLWPTEQNLRHLLAPILTTWDEDWAGFIASSLQHMKMDLRIPPLARDEELRQLRMPTLVLAAEKDLSFPADRIAQRLNSIQSEIRVEILRDAKHCPPTTIEFRQWIGSRLTKFFTE